MFKIAKNISTTNENVDVEIVNIEIGNVNNKTNKLEKHTIRALEISVSGLIDNDEYCLHFTITEPISKYCKIKEFEKIKIDQDKIIDNYVTINGIAHLDLIIELEVLRFSDELVLSLFFKDSDNEFFGNVECSIDLAKIFDKK